MKIREKILEIHIEELIDDINVLENDAYYHEYSIDSLCNSIIYKELVFIKNNDIELQILMYKQIATDLIEMFYPSRKYELIVSELNKETSSVNSKYMNVNVVKYNPKQVQLIRKAFDIPQKNRNFLFQELNRNKFLEMKVAFDRIKKLKQVLKTANK